MTDINVRSMKEKDIGQAAEIHRKVMRNGPGRDVSYSIEDLFSSFIKKRFLENQALHKYSC